MPERIWVLRPAVVGRLTNASLELLTARPASRPPSEAISWGEAMDQKPSVLGEHGASPVHDLGDLAARSRASPSRPPWPPGWRRVQSRRDLHPCQPTTAETSPAGSRRASTARC